MVHGYRSSVFLVMVHGFKDILGKLNTLNTKLQTSGVTYGTVKVPVNATIAGLKRDFLTNSGCNRKS